MSYSRRDFLKTTSALQRSVSLDASRTMCSRHESSRSIARRPGAASMIRDLTKRALDPPRARRFVRDVRVNVGKVRRTDMYDHRITLIRITTVFHVGFA